VTESASKGHGRRLAQRQRALVGVEPELQDAQHTHAKLTEQAAAIGPPRERADRDFRTQTIMTCRTLLLENALMAFMVGLCEQLPTKVSLDCILRLLFARSGTRIETVSQVVYWVNTAGFSVALSTPPDRGCRRALCNGVEGSRQTDSCWSQRHAALRRLHAWAARMSIFKKLSEVRFTHGVLNRAVRLEASRDPCTLRCTASSAS